MEKEAEKILAAGGAVEEGSNYTCTSNENSTLPALYTVKITNSNSGDGYDNRGRRITAIAYIVTDKGVYYSDGTINHSVMSVVKAIFNNTYLKDVANVNENGELVSGSPLEKALTESSSTYENLTNALNAAPTSTEQRSLLFSVHIALNK